MLKYLPWITAVLTVVLIFNPLGFDFIRTAFFSSEQLSRNIAQPIVAIAAVILAGLAVAETALRHWRRR